MFSHFLKVLVFSLVLITSQTRSFASLETLKNLEDAFVSISDKVGPAVVTIGVVQVIKSQLPQGRISPNPFLDDFFRQFFGGTPGREFKQKGLGSGFIINKEGYILTNDHVVGDADEIEVTLPDGRNFQAKLIGSDPRSDIALIKIEGKDLPFITLGNSDQVKPGQWCLALGNPFGNFVNNPNPTITSGIVSAIHRTINVREDDRMYGDLIQTDAPINQGNSGGPLVNINGEVIGINTLIFSPSGGNVGIGFAIPINRTKMILDDLISGKEIKHGWLGIWLQDVNRDIVKQFGLSEEKSGALIFKVEEKSPAEKAGFQSGDIILEINGKPVQSPNDVSRIVSVNRPGTELKVKIFRKQKTEDLTVTIGERETGQEESSKTSEDFLWRGITPDNITDDIAEKLQLKSKEGVVVTKVEFGSPAHQARIQPGDVIYSIAQTPVNNLEDFKNLSSKHKKGNVLVQTSRGYVVIFDEKEK